MNLPQLSFRARLGHEVSEVLEAVWHTLLRRESSDGVKTQNASPKKRDADANLGPPTLAPRIPPAARRVRRPALPGAARSAPPDTGSLGSRGASQPRGSGHPGDEPAHRRHVRSLRSASYPGPSTLRDRMCKPTTLRTWR